jgi:hypothetical protein
MRWEDEPYVKLYTRNTITWKTLGWEGRLVLLELLRHVDRAGLLDLGMFEPVAALAALLDIPEEIVGEGWARVVEKSCAVLRRGTEGLVILLPNFIEAQKARQSDAARQRKSRENARSKARWETLTDCDGPVTPRAAPVTPRNGSVTPRIDPREEKRSRSGSGGASSAPRTPAVPQDAVAKNPGAQSGDVSAFVRYVAAEWPDLKEPVEFEMRARAAFPAVDPLVEAKKARGWELSSPTRRKHNHGKFLWGWLGRAQDDAARTGGSVPPSRRAQNGNGHAEPSRVPGPRETEPIINARRDLTRGIGRAL